MATPRTRMVRTLIVTALVVLGVGLVCPWPLAASPGSAQEITMSLSPLLNELTLEPGSKTSFDVLVSTASQSHPARFRVYVCDVVQAQNGNYKIVDAGTSPWSAARWIKLSADALDLAPGEAGGVTAQVTVPRGARGGRYAAVVFELEPELPPPGEDVTASNVYTYRMASVVEITVPDRRLRKQLSLTGVTVTTAAQDQRLRSQFGSRAVQLAATVKNESDVHVFAKGALILRTSDGKRFRQIPLGGGRGVVLPGATVALASILPAGLPEGSYIAEASVSYGGFRPAATKAPFSVGPGVQAGQPGPQTVPVAIVSVEPEQVELSAVPGAVRTVTLVVTNREGHPLHIEGRVVPLAFTEDGEVSTELAREDPRSCARWITLSPQSFDIRAGGRQTVRVMVAVPKGEARGGRYANVLLECRSAVAGAQAAGAAVTEVGSSLLLTLGSGVTKTGSVERVDAALGSGALGNTFSATFLNSGETHVGLRATFTLKRHVMPASAPGIEYVGPGEYVEVEKVELPEVAGVVLPGSRRTVGANLLTLLEPGRYRLEVVMSYGGAQPAVGSKDFEVPPV